MAIGFIAFIRRIYHMAGLLPSFLSGAQLIVRLGGSTVAFAQALSFSDNMTQVPVGGIGSYSYHTLEPVQYAVQGSLVITSYSRLMASKDAFTDANNGSNVGKKTGDTVTSDSGQAPGPIVKSNADTVAGAVVRGGNRLLIPRHFNPVQLLLAQTFDITVHARFYSNSNGFATPAGFGPILYTIKDCRGSGWGTGLNPGSLMGETFSYVARRLIDHSAEAS